MSSHSIESESLEKLANDAAIKRVRLGMDIGYSIKDPHLTLYLQDLFSPRPPNIPINKIYLRTENANGEQNLYAINRKGKISNRRFNVTYGKPVWMPLTVDTIIWSPLKLDAPFYFLLQNADDYSNTSFVREIILVEKNTSRRKFPQGELDDSSIERDFFTGLLEIV